MDAESIQKASANLPAWAQKAEQRDSRAQPWKKQIEVTPEDERAFGQGEDLLPMYSSPRAATGGAGDGTLAA